MINPAPKHDVSLAPDGSGYLHDGKLYERLTHIIGEEYPYLGPTDNGQGRARGSYIHSCFEALIDDDLDVDSIEAPYRGYVDGLVTFMQLLGQSHATILAREIPLWHPWGYGCTVDVALIYQEKRSLLELKTGSTAHVGLQLGGQAFAWDENFPDRPLSDIAWCLSVVSNGTPKLDPIDLVESRADFAATLRVHHYKQRNR